MNLREILIKARTSGKFGDAFDMKDFLKSCGFQSGVHVGDDPDTFDDQKTVEWFIGQGISMLENNELFGMNSWFNCIEKFVPEHYEVNTDYFDDELFEI
jgi:hypothetical protein